MRQLSKYIEFTLEDCRKICNPVLGFRSSCLHFAESHVFLNYLKKFGLPLCFFVLSGCAKQIREHGWAGRNEDISTLRVGRTSIAEAEGHLGVPTYVSAFDQRIHYYIGYKTVLPVSFLRPRVEDLHGFILIFNDHNILTTLATLDPSAARTVVETTQETVIEKKYSDIALGKIFKNLGQQGSGRKGL